MASSGWQGQKDIQTSKYPHMALNLYITSISHSGTTLTYSGYVRALVTGSSRISYNGGSISLTGGGSKTMNFSMDSTVSGGRTYQDTGTFTCTINNVPATTTSYNVTASLSAGSVASGSATWTLQFGASSVAPSGLAITNVIPTYNTVTYDWVVDNWGSGTGRTVETMVLETPYVSGVPRTYKAIAGQSGGTVTITNSDMAASAGGVEMKGMGLYYTGMNASNGTLTRFQGPSFYTAPAPSIVSYSHQKNSTFFVVSVAGDPAKNHTTYDQSAYKKVVRYKLNDSWTTRIFETTVETTDTATVPVPFGASVQVEVWQEYHGVKSVVNSFMLTNNDNPSHLYGPVDGRSKKINKLYGSVVGESKEIVKLYASVGGVSKQIYNNN